MDKLDDRMEKIAINGENSGKIIRGIFSYIKNKIVYIGILLGFGVLVWLCMFFKGMEKKINHNTF